MNKLTQKHIARALLAAAESDYTRVNIGAVIAIGSRVVSVGWNSTKSHPVQKYYNVASGRVAPKHACHAEMAAIIKAGSRDLSGSTLYVGRYDMLGRLAMCRPCTACRLAMERRRIRNVVYTTERGILHDRLHALPRYRRAW